MTFPPIHPDHRQAYDEIFAIAQANPALDLANALNAAAIADVEEEVADPQPEIGNDLDPQPEIRNNLELEEGVGIDIQLANDDELLEDGDDESMHALDIVDLL